MSVPLKLASFGVALVAAFALSYGVGAAVGPVGGSSGKADATTPTGVTTTTSAMDMDMDGGSHP